MGSTHGPRYRIKRTPGDYVQRNRKGQFKEWTDIHRGISIDKAHKVPQKTSKPGYGHRQDYKKSKPKSKVPKTKDKRKGKSKSKGKKKK